MDALSRLDGLPEALAAADLRRCCGSTRWVERMIAARPFGSRDRLFAFAEAAWRDLEPEDWREAFAEHPKIGDQEALRARFAETREWALGEQAGTLGAMEATLSALARENQAYEARFGHIFIVCATGKSAEEMLSLLCARLGNDPETELHIAAGEQAKITRLRLLKLLAT
jgi:2-oxo-4-hydroxy-4-carboxy-5-ureidoimidazoline decarboxylase